MDDRTPKPSVDVLLARRDGELLDAEQHAAIDADLDSRLRVRRFEVMKDALAALPAVEPDPELWASIQAQAAGTVTRLPEQAGVAKEGPGVTATPAGSRWRMPYPLATAAAVFTAVLGLSLTVGPEFVRSGNSTQPMPSLEHPVTTTGAVVPSEDASAIPSLDQLVDRSQTLEAVARMPVVRAADSTDPSREALLYRIATIDAEFNALMEQEAMDPTLRKKLWQQRVELLETLLAIQKDQLMKAAELH